MEGESLEGGEGGGGGGIFYVFLLPKDAVVWVCVPERAPQRDNVGEGKGASPPNSPPPRAIHNIILESREYYLSAIPPHQA